MAPLIAPLSRAWRSKLTTKCPRTSGAAGRVLAGTTRNLTTAGVTSKLSTPSVNIPQDLRMQTRRSPISHTPARLRGQQTPFEDLLNNIANHLTSTPLSSRSPQIPYLHSLLRSYESNSSHWEKFAHANPGKHYTRNLVCDCPGVFSLLLLVWTPGQKSPVHDHADAHCLMKILKGHLQETRFAIPNFPGMEGPLVETSRKSYGTEKVSYMADSLGLHSISNPHQTEYAVSLHLYTPPNAEMNGCHVYDIENGTTRHVMQGAYDSVYGVVSTVEKST